MTFDVLFSLSAWLRKNQWGVEWELEGAVAYTLVFLLLGLVAGMEINCQDPLGIPTCYPQQGDHVLTKEPSGRFWVSRTLVPFIYQNPCVFIKY